MSGKGIIPGLAAVLVGDDAASRIYVGQKHKASADVGIRSEQVDLPAYVTEHELLATIRRLNRDPEIHGIIVQLPLPDHLPELDIQRAILPEKDVDVIKARRDLAPTALCEEPFQVANGALKCVSADMHGSYQPAFDTISVRPVASAGKIQIQRPDGAVNIVQGAPAFED